MKRASRCSSARPCCRCAIAFLMRFPSPKERRSKALLRPFRKNKWGEWKVLSCFNDSNQRYCEQPPFLVPAQVAATLARRVDSPVKLSAETAKLLSNELQRLLQDPEPCFSVLSEDVSFWCAVYTGANGTPYEGFVCLLCFVVCLTRNHQVARFCCIWIWQAIPRALRKCAL